MKLLTPDGTPVRLVETDTKKAHDPREVATERARLKQMFQTIRKEFLQDMAPSEDGEDPARASFSAARKHHGDRWADIVDAVSKSSIPLEGLDREAMYQMADHWKAYMEQQRDMQRPLHEVAGLGGRVPGDPSVPAVGVGMERFGFKLIGKHDSSGFVFLSHQCALCISDTGMVHVVVKHPWQDETYWVDQPWLHMNMGSVSMLHVPHYTVKELFEMLGGARINALSEVNEDQAMIARQRDGRSTVVSKPWWKFWVA